MSRQAVLTYLRAREGEYLSGEELSRQLGLSRHRRVEGGGCPAARGLYH